MAGKQYPLCGSAPTHPRSIRVEVRVYTAQHLRSTAATTTSVIGLSTSKYLVVWRDLSRYVVEWRNVFCTTFPLASLIAGKFLAAPVRKVLISLL